MKMDSLNDLNLLVMTLLALASLITVPCTIAQDCQYSPESCDATQVLSDFSIFLDTDTSHPDSPQYCNMYVRTWLSEDSTRAEYITVYMVAGDTTPVQDTCTFEVAEATLIYTRCANYSDGAVFYFKLYYVNGDHCIVGRTKVTLDSDEYFYLLSSPDCDMLEYKKCLGKIVGYSGGNTTFLRDPERCANISQGPQ